MCMALTRHRPSCDPALADEFLHRVGDVDEAPPAGHFEPEMFSQAFHTPMPHRAGLDNPRKNPPLTRRQNPPPCCCFRLFVGFALDLALCHTNNCTCLRGAEVTGFTNLVRASRAADFCHLAALDSTSSQTRLRSLISWRSPACSTPLKTIPPYQPHITLNPFTSDIVIRRKSLP